MPPMSRPRSGRCVRSSRSSSSSRRTRPRRPEKRARTPRVPEADATDVPFVTIDPPASRDLDQALHLERRDGGYRVRYAIADVAAFVDAGGALDREAHARGETLYAPDANARLYPPELSEGAASLLPDGPRPALVWTLDLDGDGAKIGVSVRRALVRSRAQLDYAGVQRSLDDGSADEPLLLLRELGLLRQAQEGRAAASTCRSPTRRSSARTALTGCGGTRRSRSSAGTRRSRCSRVWRRLG